MDWYGIFRLEERMHITCKKYGCAKVVGNPNPRIGMIIIIVSVLTGDGQVGGEFVDQSNYTVVFLGWTGMAF